MNLSDQIILIVVVFLVGFSSALGMVLLFLFYGSNDLACHSTLYGIAQAIL